MLLVLDELHQLTDPADGARVAYMLADGAGKSRLNRDLSARRRRTWRTFVISTGEHDLATAARHGGKALPTGADVRLPSLRVPDAAEGWPALHARVSLRALWADLHRGMKAQYGVAARAFLRHLTVADEAEVHAVADAMRDRFTAELPKDADPQVREVVNRFALVATAGTLATKWGVLPWPVSESEHAAVTMLSARLRSRPGGAGLAERAKHLGRIRRFLVQHGASRFTVLIANNGEWEERFPDRPVVNRVGWRKLQAGKGRDRYLITPEAWREEVCVPTGLDPVATAKTLAEAGFLRRGDRSRLQADERLPGHEGKVRMYVIDAAILEGPELPAEGAPHPSLHRPD